MVAADTDREALELGRRAWPLFYASFMKLWKKHGTQPRYARIPEDFDTMVKNGGALAGSPGTIRDLVRNMAGEAGASYFIAQFSFGDLSHQEVLHSAGIFAREVLPASAGARGPRRLAGAHTRQVGCAHAQRRASVDNRIMKLFKHEIKRRQIFLFDRAVVESVERFTEHGVHLALHGEQLFRIFRLAHPGNHGQNLFPMVRVSLAFAPPQIVTQPGAGRTEPGENQDGEPEVIAVPVEECAFVAVDVGRRSPMHWQLGVLVGVRFLEVGGAGHLPGKRLTNGKHLPGQCGDRGFRQVFRATIR